MVLIVPIAMDRAFAANAKPLGAQMFCNVTDLKGNHCPEKPVHSLVNDGEVVYLCDRCFANVLAGAYGAHLTPRAPDVKPVSVSDQ